MESKIILLGILSAFFLIIVACEDDQVNAGNDLATAAFASNLEEQMYDEARTATSDSSVVVFCHHLVFPLRVTVVETDEEIVMNNLDELSSKFPASGTWRFGYPIFLETIPDEVNVTVQSEQELEEIEEDCDD